jgi:GlpG protein
MLPTPGLDFQRTPVTLTVTAIAAAIEAICFIDPGQRALFADELRLGMLSLVWSGEYWRPFTSTLMHGSFLHAAFNIYWMLIFGSVLEPACGALRYLGIVVLLGTTSTMLQFLAANWDSPLDAQVPSVGLSGILYGLFGLLWVGRRWRREFYAVCSDQVVHVLVAWFFICIVLTHLDMLPVANVAHGAGLGFGALYAMAFYSRRRRRLWQAGAVAATVLALAVVVAAPGHPLYEKHMRAMRVRELIEQVEPHAGDAP